jgi:hypothetical protein
MSLIMTGHAIATTSSYPSACIAEQDPARLLWRKVESNDPRVPPRAHLVIRAIAERITRKAEYDRAVLAAAGPPGAQETSAIPEAA